jgi:hypothetical protein
MRDLRRVIVIFVGQDFLRVVEDVGAGLAVVHVWWRDPFAVAVGTFAGYRDGGLRLPRKCW